MALTACQSSVYDDLTNCPTEISISAYSQTPCQTAPVYPKVGVLRVLVFDAAGHFLTTFEDNAPQLSPTYKLTKTLTSTGKHTFVIWAGASLSSLDFSALKVGESTLADAYAIVRTGANGSFSAPLFVGQKEEEVVQTLEEGASTEIKVNLEQLNNTLHFTINGLKEDGNYELTIREDHAKYNFAGQILPSDTTVYTTTLRKEGKSLKADLEVLKLVKGHHPRIEVKDLTSNKVIYSADLLDDILLYDKEHGTPPYSLECDHEFDIQLTINPDTYMLVRAVVNDWNLITRDVELDN